ncbi:MAG: glycosyltransferase family 4 protein [Gammaproteobacteria bacterium]|nr:glycosyltransferase family 4 protein [Gammaproteobacteria bacterium]
MLGIEKNSIAILYVGRLSFHAKAHPLPMYVALNNAAKRIPKKIYLIECGWFPNEGLRSAFEDAFNTLTNNVNRIVIDGRNQEQKFNAIAASDIFCSLSDNIQETFGITPIEAMAAGLPVLITDWNGYKESIEHGIHGFKVSTTMPRGGGAGTEIAKRYAMGLDDYNMYLGYTSSHVAVDIVQATNYLSELIENSALRKKLANAASKRAKTYYDWETIIPAYEELWSELREIREKSNSEFFAKHRWPARPDPFRSFSHYPTTQLSVLDKVAFVFESEQLALARFKELITLAMVSYTGELLPTKSHVQEIIHTISLTADQAIRIGELVNQERGEEDTLLAVSWLLKVGLLFHTTPEVK